MTVNYFKNKVCTILTVSVNMGNLSKSEMASIFTGRILEIDDKGVLVDGIQGLKAFFNHDFIVGILEEEVVKKDDPRIQKQALNMDALKKMVN